jgi:glycosyltransferase involved in cell wall biosynthesis
MRIGIDISQVVYGTGVSEYTKELVRALTAIDRQNEYVLFGGSLRRRNELKSFVSSLIGKVSGKLYPFPPLLANLIWNKFHFLKIENLIGKVDVFHSSDWAQPPSRAFKVTTVHDLSPIKFPKLTSPQIVKVYTQRLKWVMREVDRIIVPSNSTKEDMIALGANREKIRVIGEAPSKVFKPALGHDIEKIKKKYHINGKYLLSVGVGPRKNTDKIIKAFDLVAAGNDLTLVMAGINSDYVVKERRGVRLVGHIPKEDLPAFYSGAEVFLYPSLYEGYGLPILEAFACGVPVVTSNISSMPEVAGDAAVLVDPYDLEALTDGINEALKNRKTLIKKGFQRVKSYSWESVARETLNVYKEVGI